MPKPMKKVAIFAIEVDTDFDKDIHGAATWLEFRLGQSANPSTVAAEVVCYDKPQQLLADYRESGGPFKGRTLITEETAPTLTEVEKVCKQANETEGLPGYHLTLKYPDGSVLDAPITEYGQNWARFAELTDYPLMVDTTEAQIEINWSPGAAEAYGPRFQFIDKRNAPAPGR